MEFAKKVTFEGTTAHCINKTRISGQISQRYAAKFEAEISFKKNCVQQADWR